MLRDAIPEERCRDHVRRIGDVAVARRRAHELRDLTIAMLARQVVLVPLERVGEGAMLEFVRQIEPAPVARIGIELGEHLVHAAVLRVEHMLNLLVVERLQHALRPSGEFDFGGERGPVARVAIRVAQPGKGLVQRVPRGPHAVQIERRRADFAARQLPERLAAVRQRAQIAVGILVLNDLQFTNDVVGARLEARIARRRVHQADGRQMMPCDVPREVAAVAVPARIWLRLFRQPGANPVIGQHPVRLEVEQIFRVEFLRALERAAEHANVLQRHRPRAHHLQLERGDRRHFGERAIGRRQRLRGRFEAKRRAKRQRRGGSRRALEKISS